MRQPLFTLLLACTWSLLCYAQTPYDSFAPEAYRPMLELEEPANAFYAITDCDFDSTYAVKYFDNLNDCKQYIRGDESLAKYIVLRKTDCENTCCNRLLVKTISKYQNEYIYHVYFDNGDCKDIKLLKRGVYVLKSDVCIILVGNHIPFYRASTSNKIEGFLDDYDRVKVRVLKFTSQKVLIEVILNRDTDISQKIWIGRGYVCYASNGEC